MSPLPVVPASLVKRSRADVIKRLLERLPRLTDYTYVGEGGIARGFLEAVAQELGNVYGLISYSFAQQLVTEATGYSLDSLGVLYNVTRRTVLISATQNAFYFYLATSPSHQTGIPTDTADEAFTIPAGTIVSIRDDAIGDILAMATTAAVTFNEGDSIHYVGVQPTASIMRTNISPHTLRVHNYTGTGYANLYCTNPVELQADTGLESDEDYRARIVEAVRGIASANKIAVKLAALSVNHVRDAKIIERPYGPATFRVVIALDYGASGNEATLAFAEVEKVRAAGTYAELTTAVEYSVDITYGVTLEDRTTLTLVQRGIDSAIKSYIGSVNIGQPLRKSVLAERMFAAAPTALDVYIAQIKVNGANFIGDVYRVPEDGMFTLSSITKL